MNPADLAVIAVTEFPLMVVGLAVVITNHRERMAVADRVRVVNPVKPPEPKADAEASKAPAAADERHSILELGRPA